MFEFGKSALKELALGGMPFFGGRVFKARKDQETIYENSNPEEEYQNEYELYTVPTESLDDASVVTSLTSTDNFHMPVLDIDVEHYHMPSSTPGHAHLYFNVACEWEDYVEFLKAAAKCGILEDDYVDVSIRKGYTAVRLPWIQRETPR